MSEMIFLTASGKRLSHNPASTRNPVQPGRSSADGLRPRLKLQPREQLHGRPLEFSSSSSSSSDSEGASAGPLPIPCASTEGSHRPRMDCKNFVSPSQNRGGGEGLLSPGLDRNQFGSAPSKASDTLGALDSSRGVPGEHRGGGEGSQRPRMDRKNFVSAPENGGGGEGVPGEHRGGGEGLKNRHFDSRTTRTIRDSFPSVLELEGLDGRPDRMSRCSSRQSSSGLDMNGFPQQPALPQVPASSHLQPRRRALMAGKRPVGAEPSGQCSNIDVEEESRTTGARSVQAAKLDVLLEGLLYHVLDPTTACEPHFQDCKGLVVLAELSDVHAAALLLSQVTFDPDRLPVVAMVMATISTPVDAESLLEAYLVLEEAGADDVIVRPEGSKEHMRASIMLAMLRAKAKCKDPHDLQCKMLDPVGEKVANTRLSHMLGQGAFGAVYLGWNEERSEQEAVKVIEKASLRDLNKVCNVWREITLLRSLRHPGVIGIRSCTHTQFYITIHMEYGGGMNLSDYLSKYGGHIDMARVWTIGHKVAEALSHCHENAIAHRDVKHDNIMVLVHPRRQLITKLIDFGLGVEVGRHSMGQKCGTMLYCPPEMLMGSTVGSDEEPDPRSGDVWALGVVMLEMAGGVGLMRRLLDWPHDVEPSVLRGEEIAATFGSGQLQASLRCLLTKDGFEGNCPAKVLSSEKLMQLLAGQLQVDVLTRLTIMEVERFTAEQVALMRAAAQLNQGAATTPVSPSTTASTLAVALGRRQALAGRGMEMRVSTSEPLPSVGYDSEQSASAGEPVPSFVARRRMSQTRADFSAEAANALPAVWTSQGSHGMAEDENEDEPRSRRRGGRSEGSGVASSAFGSAQVAGLNPVRPNGRKASKGLSKNDTLAIVREGLRW